MTRIELKIVDFLKSNVIYFFLIAITLCGVFLRTFGMKFESLDYYYFLHPWWNKIQGAGVEVLATQVGNYNIPYQIIIYLFTLLPFSPLNSYKLLSIFFDFVLACSSGLLVYSFSKNNSKLKGLITYAVVLCSIPVILNSSFWGQCDSIYVSFIILSLYFLKMNKNISCFVFLGLALAFKLQVVFILPFYVYYYFTTRKISILHFLIMPAVDVIMCLPAIALGRPFVDIIKIYMSQTEDVKALQSNFPNFYAIFCEASNTNNYYLLKTFSIVFTFTLLGSALAFLLYKNVNLHNTNNLLFTAIWSVFTCIMFLSSMHDRYSYLLDILTIIYAVFAYKKLWLPIICNFITIRSYSNYLFQYDMLDIKITAIIYMAVYFYVSYLFYRDVLRDGEKISVKPKMIEKQN